MEGFLLNITLRKGKEVCGGNIFLHGAQKMFVVGKEKNGGFEIDCTVFEV